MTKKKILLVTRAFYPDISPRSFRATELVKEFARQGHNVTVLTIKDMDHHVPFEQQYGVTIKDLGQLLLPNINISGVGRLTTLGKRALNRGLLMLFEYPAIELMYRVKQALKKEQGYDLLISIAVPHPIHWGVAWARSAKHPVAGTWVADCGDPYMGNTTDSFRKLFYFGFLERWFCRKADYITVPIEGAKEAYCPEFMNKFRVVPQGFDFEEFDFSDSYQGNSVPTFAYAGGFIPGARDPQPFLEWLVSREDDFKFYIFTKTTSLITPYLSRANGRIEIKDYLPRAELLTFLSKMDFLVNIHNNTSRQLPSKLIDYYLTGRPVFSVASGAIEAEAAERFLVGDYSGRHAYEDVEQYKIATVRRQFLELGADSRRRS